MGDTIELLRMIERVDAKVEALIQYLIDEDVLKPEQKNKDEKEGKKK